MTEAQYNALLHATDRVVGKSPIIKITGAIVGATATTYSSGQNVGSYFAVEMARSVNGTGIIQSIIIKDLSKQSSSLDVVFFDSIPTGTYTNATTCDIADSDIDKVIGFKSVLSSDYAAFNDNSIATVSAVALPFQASGTNKLYALIVSRGTPTYVANELSIAFGILQDA